MLTIAGSKAMRNVCRDYIMGRCHRGTECKFVHTVPKEVKNLVVERKVVIPRAAVPSVPPTGMNATQPPLTASVQSPTLTSVIRDFATQVSNCAPPTVRWSHLHYFDNIDTPHTEQLSRLLSADCVEHAIIGVAGPQGSGKTTLTIEVCREVVKLCYPTYPLAQLEADNPSWVSPGSQDVSRHGSIATDVAVVSLDEGQTQLVIIDCLPFLSASVLHAIHGERLPCLQGSLSYIQSKEHYVAVHCYSFFLTLLATCNRILWVMRSGKEALQSIHASAALHALQDACKLYGSTVFHVPPCPVQIVLLEKDGVTQPDVAADDEEDIVRDHFVDKNQTILRISSLSMPRLAQSLLQVARRQQHQGGASIRERCNAIARTQRAVLHSEVFSEAMRYRYKLEGGKIQ